jgi:hypothetical protein
MMHKSAVSCIEASYKLHWGGNVDHPCELENNQLMKCVRAYVPLIVCSEDWVERQRGVCSG